MYDRERRPGYFRNEEPQSGRRVEARVKWFNAAKGFGFVTLTDGSPDAFLPMAVLRRAGYDNVGEGAVLVCEIGPGAKGPLVLNVLNVDESQVVARAPRGGGYGDRGDRGGRDSYGDRGGGYGGGGGSGGPAQSLDGAVKWFEPDKGYGFISPDGGGKDIFIHVTALRRSGVNELAAGQRVRVDVVEGRKGLEADRVTLI
ncbi:MAG TPA: cold-shock protein [Stellaceae bacterium]|jgi:CspA family cold shock protein